MDSKFEYQVSGTENCDGYGTHHFRNQYSKNIKTYACFSDFVLSTYWVPVVQGKPIDGQKGRYFWLDDRPGSNKSVMEGQKWRPGQPNGLHLQQCLGQRLINDEFLWADYPCTRQDVCTVCSVPAVQKYQLRGLGLFDHAYTLSWTMQQDKEIIVFEGESSSQLIWYPLKRRTELKNEQSNIAKAFEKDPFGLLSSQDGGKLLQWIFTNVCFVNMEFHFTNSSIFVCFCILCSSVMN